MPLEAVVSGRAFEPRYRSGSGSSSGLSWIDVTDPIYGADKTGVLDSTAAFQAAVDVAGPHVVYIPAGTYKLTSTVTINQSRVTLMGDGEQVTILNVATTVTDTPAIHFWSGSSAVLFQCRVRGITFSCASTAGIKRVGLRATEVSDFQVEDVAAYPFTSNGDSIAVQIRGHEFIHVRNCSLSADRPLVIENNPYISIDIDHSTFTKLELHATGSNACIFFDDGVTITNCRIQDVAAIGGKHAIYFNDTTTTGFSQHLVIENVRWEQHSANDGYTVYFVSQWGYRQLVLRNIQSGAATNRGYYVRNVDHVTIENCGFYGNAGAVALDCDGTVTSLILSNNFFVGGSTVSLTGLRLLWSISKALDSTEPIWRTEYWETTTGNANLTAAGLALRLGGVYIHGIADTVNDGIANRVAIPIGNGAQKCGLIRVSGRGTSGSTYEGGIVLISDVGATLISGTANFGVGNVPGKLTVFFENASTITLANQTGVNMYYEFTTEWR
jgi:hypothetical protein